MKFEPLPMSILYVNGMLVQAVEDREGEEGCENCVFKDSFCSNVYCAGTLRHDKKYIHFEEVKDGND